MMCNEFRMIYIDSIFKCHTVDGGTMTAVEISFFDGECDTYVKGYRFIPNGESLVCLDGQTTNVTISYGTLLMRVQVNNASISVKVKRVELI